MMYPAYGRNNRRGLSACCWISIILGILVLVAGIVILSLWGAGVIFSGSDEVTFTDSEEAEATPEIKEAIAQSKGLGVSAPRKAHRAAALIPDAEGVIGTTKVKVRKDRVIVPLTKAPVKDIKKILKRAPAKMPQLQATAIPDSPTSKGGLRATRKEIKSKKEARNPTNVKKIKEGGKEKLVEYTGIESKRLWYCARCTNMLENIPAPANTPFRIKLKAKTALRMKNKYCKLSSACGICMIGRDGNFSKRMLQHHTASNLRKTSIHNLGGDKYLRYWK